MSTHSLGVMCGVCKEQLEPDNCCPGYKHGSTYQAANDWAAKIWPNHPCFTDAARIARGTQP